MGKELVNKIREINPLAKRGMLLLVFLASFACLLSPRDSVAAPAINNAWTNVYASAASTASINLNSAGFAVSAGTNRLLLVAVNYEAAQAGTFSAHAVTYGGVTVTPIGTTGATSLRSHTWLGYIKEANIPAGSNAVNVTSTFSANLSGVQIATGSYTAVDQATPITSSVQATAGDNLVAFPSAVSYNAGSITVLASSNGGSAPAFAVTGVANGSAFVLEAGASSTVGGFGGFVAVSGVNATANSYTTSCIVSYTGTTSNRSSMVAAALNPYVSAVTSTSAGVATVAANTDNTIDVSATYSDDSNANNTLQIEYKRSIDPSYTTWTTLPHSVSPYAAMISGLSASTSYDVRVTYLDANGVTGTAQQVIAGVTTKAPGIYATTSWTNVINDSTTRATGAVINLFGNFAVTAPTGSNRFLVVAIAQHNTANTAPAAPSTISYGGVTLTLATSNRITSARQHTWLYYLKDTPAVMNGASQTLALSWTVGIASTKIDVYCATFTGVDQATPIVVGTQVANTASTSGASLNVAMNIGANSRAIYVINDLNTTNTAIPSWAPNANWTTPNSVAVSGFIGTSGVYGYRHEFAQRVIPATATTDNAITGARTSSRYAMSALVLPPVSVSVATGAAAPDLSVYAGDTNKVVDAFTMAGSGSVTSIQVTGNANTTDTNISAIRIYRKGDANTTVYTPGGVDTLIGSGTFGPVGTTPVNIAVSEPVSASTNYIIVYDIASGAIANGTSITFSGAVTALTPAAGTLVDAGATLTLYAKTLLGTGTEPLTDRLWTNSAPTRLDAFTLAHTGSATDDDTVTNITIRMSPKYITGGSGGTQSKFKALDGITITDSLGVKVSTAEVVCSTTAAPPVIDNYDTCTINTNIPVTSTQATYYVVVATANVINPSVADTSGTVTGYYAFNGKISTLSHLRSSNFLVLDDNASQTVAIDVETPLGPASANGNPGTNGGEINLAWALATDANSGALHPLTPYLIRRSAPDGTVPAVKCTEGVDLAGVPGVSINTSARTVTDKGLIDTSAIRYYYRICAEDSLGNISDGIGTFSNTQVTMDCNNPPEVTLTPVSQLIKSTNSPAFTLNVTNNDQGPCPDVTFDLSIVNEVGNVAHFDKSIPATLTVGSGSSGTGTPVGDSKDVIITGRPEAAQLETYKFAVRVSTAGDTHGAAVTSAQVTGLLNDMPPIVHNSANMGLDKYGQWGQTYTCATCHSNSTTNIKGVYTIISTPIGRRNVVFTKTSSVAADSNGTFGTDLRAVRNVSNNVCSVCHHRTTQHQYSANKADLNFGNGQGVTGPNSDTAYTTDHHNSRDCARCHTHNTAFRSITGVCGDCHGNKITGYFPVNKATMVHDKVTNALGNDSNYGAHRNHNNVKIGCGACHNTTNHGLDTTAWVGDRILEMGFSINKDTFQGFNQNLNIETGSTFFGTAFLSSPYVWSPGPGTTITPIADYNASCSTYCHGNWAGNSGSATTPIWVGTGQTACGTCHDASGSAPPASGSHTKHAADFGAGLGIACSKCHGTLSNFTGAAHVNGLVQWDMTAYPGSTYSNSPAFNTGNPAPTATFGTCNTLYCHSTVQGANGLGAPEYKVATWGGTAACGSCHVMPNNTGSHSSHINAEVSFDCHICHNTGGTTTALNHGNGAIDFKFVGLGQNTKYGNISTGTKLPGTGYGLCSTSDCHGRFTRAWGTVSSGLTMCDKCHGSATSPRGFYNTQGPDGTLSIYSTGVGLHDIHIQNPNSPRKATFARFTSYAAGYSCRQCHYSPTGPFSPGHMDNALPAESTFSHLTSIAHKGDAFQYYSTPTYTFATQTCSAVWCHGAGMNSNRAKGKYVGTTPPSRLNPKWSAPYLTGNGASDCTRCHALPPPAPDNTYVHYGRTMASCTSCHQHVSNDGYGFKNKNLHINGIIEGGCDGCHGDPPITNVVGASDGLATPAQNALNGGAGAHAAHMVLPLIGNNCYTCHNTYNQAMPSNELEISFNGLGGLVTTGTFTGYTNSVNGPNWKITGGTNLIKSNVKAAVCSNLYCHGGGSSVPLRLAIGGGANTSPDWEVPAVCGDCHGVDSANAPAGGSHPRHAITVAALTCQSCHGIVADNGTHVNAAVSWKLDRSNPVIGSGATYMLLSSGSIAGLAPHTSYQACNNVYCHSTIQSGNGTGVPTYQTVQWGNNGTLGCNGCHKDMANDAAPTGSHLKHANPALGMNVPCGYCHQDGGDGSAIHADGSVFVNFTSYIGGAYSVGTPYLTGMQKAAQSVAFGTCSATFCHGTADSPAWGTAGPLACNACHSAKADDVSWSGRHTTHYDSYTAPTNYTQTVTDLSTATKYRFNCAHCHDDNVAKHSLKPASADAAARVFFGISSATPSTSSKRGTYAYGSPQGSTDNGFKFTNGACNGSYCHSNGRGGAPKLPTLTWITAPSGNNCAYCHDTKSIIATATQLSGKHDKHMNPTNNAMIGTGNGFNCVDCHTPTITDINNTTIANKGRHVNATLNYSGARAYRTGYTLGSGSCSTYCHSNGNPNASGTPIFVSMTGSKIWSGAGTITTCNKCHGRSNSTGYPDYANGLANTATSNLHAGHMSGLTDTLACADCHRKTADTIAVNKFRPYTTLHLNGGRDVSFNKSKSYIGANANVATAGNQVTCSNIVCHGQGAPVWGTSTTANQCQKCHGSRATAFQTYTSPQVAPGYGADGTDTSLTKTLPTDPRVGAHQRHLATSAISGPIKCRECHVPVTAIRSANHWNYSTATLTFTGARATNNHTPSVSRTGGIMQCSNVNCHAGTYNSGSTIAPFWNMTGLVKETGTTVGDCVKCHAMAPTAVASHPSLSSASALSTIVANCQSCHTNVSSSATNVGNAFTNKALHVNGITDVTLNCNSCHDYDTTGGGTAWGTTNYGGTTGNEGRGAHAKHIEYLKAKTGYSLIPGDTYGSAAFNAICGVCHSQLPGDHTMSTSTNPRSINFNGSIARQFGNSAPFYNGSTASTATKKSSALKPKSCSNIDCHYRTSPIWSTY